jgi:hypothetical protein
MKTLTTAIIGLTAGATYALNARASDETFRAKRSVKVVKMPKLQNEIRFKETSFMEQSPHRVSFIFSCGIAVLMALASSGGF